MAAIFKVIMALPKIISAIETALSLYNTYKDEAWFKEAREAFVKARNPKTKKEKQDAVRSIRNALRGAAG